MNPRLCVGLIKSEQHERRFEREGKGETYEAFLKARAGDIPLRRFGEAEEFANIACFLASDKGGYIAGVAINVDGGRSPVV